MLRHRGLGSAYTRPIRMLCESRIELYKAFLILWDFGGIDDGTDWTFCDTDRTVDALVWMNHNEVRPFEEAIHGTDSDTVCVFTLDTCLGNDEGHKAT